MSEPLDWNAKTMALNATASTPSKRGATQALPSTNAKLLESAPFPCSN